MCFFIDSHHTSTISFCFENLHCLDVPDRNLGGLCVECTLNPNTSKREGIDRPRIDWYVFPAYSASLINFRNDFITVRCCPLTRFRRTSINLSVGLSFDEAPAQHPNSRLCLERTSGPPFDGHSNLSRPSYKYVGGVAKVSLCIINRSSQQAGRLFPLHFID